MSIDMQPMQPVMKRPMPGPKQSKLPTLRRKAHESHRDLAQGEDEVTVAPEAFLS